MAIRFIDEPVKKKIRFLDEQPPEKEEGVPRTMLEQGLQGATFGFADEISSAIGAGIAAAATDESFADLYQEARQSSEERMKRQQEQNPVTAVGSQFLGAIGTGVAGGATKAGQSIISSIGRSGLAGRAAKSAVVGGASGAISGFGSAEGDFKDRVQGAETGAVLGASIGAAIPVVGSIAKGIVNSARSAGKVVKGRSADAIVADVLANQDLNALQKTLKETGNIEVLADIAGDEAQGLLRSVAKKTGGTKNLVSDFLENRSQESGRRINDILSKKVSNVDNYFQNLDDLAKGRAVAANPLYKAAREKGANLKQTERFNTLMQDPRIIKAMDEGKSKFGVSAEAKRNSIDAIDGAKKALDDDINALEREGRSQAAAQLRSLKNELIDIADSQVPEYKKARAVFGGFKSIEDAQEKGLAFLREDPEMITRIAKEMTPSEHDAYLIGVRRALKNQVDRTADSGDPAKKIFGNQLIRDKIKAAFPNEKGFDEFSKRMFQEMRAADTKFKVLGGSRTDFNIAQDGALLLDALENTARGQGLKEQIVDAFITGVKNRAIGLTDANAKKVANILIDKEKGLDAIETLIKQNNANQAAVIKGFIPDFNKIRSEQAAIIGFTTGE